MPVSDVDRIRVAQRLRGQWPSPPPKLHAAMSTARTARSYRAMPASDVAVLTRDAWDEPDLLHAGRFGEESPLLAVHLGAGTSAKRWPARHWKVLIGRFLDDGWRVILIGGPDDIEIAEQLHTNERLCDWTGQLPLTQTAALLERAGFFIGSDSGPAHVAASAGIPSLILFSGTNRPRQWRPWSRRTLMILRNRVACRPCHQRGLSARRSPLHGGDRARSRVPGRPARWWRRLHRQESPRCPALGRRNQLTIWGTGN